MSSHFKSLLAELLPGWAFWRSSPRPTKPLDGAPLGRGVDPSAVEQASERAPSPDRMPAPPAANDQPPADPDSLNRRL